jgi:hypothetical protein
MNSYAPGTPEWFSQVHEEVVDPARRIVDPHHHLWPVGGSLPYGLDQLHDDASSLNAAQVIAKMDQHILLQLAKQSLLLESHYETLRISSRALLPMPTSVVMTSTTFLMHTQK